MPVQLFQFVMVSVQILYLVLQHRAGFNDWLLNNATNAAEALVVAQHLHLVYAIDHLWGLLDLLIDYFDGGVVRAVRVLLEFDAVVNQKVHEPLFLLWRKQAEHKGLNPGTIFLVDRSYGREAARIGLLLSLERLVGLRHLLVVNVGKDLIFERYLHFKIKINSSD